MRSQCARRSGLASVPLLPLLLLAAAAACARAASDAGASPSPSPPGDGLEGELVLDYPAGRNADDQPVLTPTKTQLAGRDLYYEVPQAPIGMYVFFHGCAHSAYDHWPQQPGCEECRGLPSEVAIAKQALSAGLAFVTINSLDRQPPDQAEEVARCFSYSEDKDTAVEALRQLRTQLELEDKPLYFGGVSSGGGFAIKLVQKMPGEVAGVTSIVLGVDPLVEVDYDWGNWPPVAFIAMTRDTAMVARIQRNAEALVDAGVPSQVILVEPRVLYWPTFFSDQSDAIPAEASGEIVSALVDIGVVDELGYVKDDPRHGFVNLPWRTLLLEKVPGLNGSDPSSSLTADSSHITELLNLAWGDHEIDGEYFTAIQEWMQGGFSGNLTDLGEEYIIRQPSRLSAGRLQPGELPATAGDPPVTPWIPPPPANGAVVRSPPAAPKTATGGPPTAGKAAPPPPKRAPVP